MTYGNKEKKITKGVYLFKRHVDYCEDNFINLSKLIRHLLDEEMKRRGAF